MPERGVARIILIGFMVLLVGFIAALFIMSGHWRAEEQRRRVLRIDLRVARDAHDVRQCLGRRSGHGLALGPSRSGPQNEIFNNAKHMDAVVEEIGGQTRVRLWSRDDYPLKASDRRILTRCLGRNV